MEVESDEVLFDFVGRERFRESMAPAEDAEEEKKRPHGGDAKIEEGAWQGGFESGFEICRLGKKKKMLYKKRDF